MRDLNKQRKESKIDTKIQFSKENFQKSFTLYFLIEIYKNIINVGILDTFELLKTEKFQRVVKISNNIAINVMNDLHSLQKLVHTKKISDFETLNVLLEFLSSLTKKKTNVKNICDQFLIIFNRFF